MSHAMSELEKRLLLSERALDEARSRRRDLEHCLAQSVRQAGAEEERAERARDLLASLEHRQEAQRSQLEHWQRLAEASQCEAASTVEELAAATAAARVARCGINDAAVALAQRLAAVLPWQPEEAAAAADAPMVDAESEAAAVAVAVASAEAAVAALQRLLDAEEELGEGVEAESSDEDML